MILCSSKVTMIPLYLPHQLIRPTLPITGRYLSAVIRKDKVHARTTTSTSSEEASALYVHWPYCLKRCHYCNFNKYISSNIDQERMRGCLTRETETLLTLSGIKNIKSIFFGGGTPSLADPMTMASVIESVKNLVAMGEDTEVTMEANPTSSEASRLAEFKAAGINRLSLGIQSFNDHHLHVLGRNHSSADALHALEDAKKLFPGRVSIDLIFGIPGQTMDDLQTDLQKALEVCDNHISLYQLTLERGTPLFKMNERGELLLPKTDIMADMYIYAVEALSQAGFSRYEVSNFAKGNCVSQHNQSYWDGGQYIGVGPGAHGRFAVVAESKHSKNTDIVREARIQALDPNSWMEEVETFGHGTRKSVGLTRLDVLNELIMTGLRTSKGIQNLTWTQLSSGSTLGEVFENSSVVGNLCLEGFLEITNYHMKATDQGLVMLDSIIPDIINELNAYFDSRLSAEAINEP